MRVVYGYMNSRDEGPPLNEFFPFYFTLHEPMKLISKLYKEVYKVYKFYKVKFIKKKPSWTHQVLKCMLYVSMFVKKLVNVCLEIKLLLFRLIRS